MGRTNSAVVTMIAMELTQQTEGLCRVRDRYGRVRLDRPHLSHDNVVKVYADALNHLAYHDDSQVVSITCEKYYSEEPRVEVILSDTEEEL